MTNNNSKYTGKMRNQNADFIIQSGKSATRVAEEMDKHQHGLPIS